MEHEGEAALESHDLHYHPLTDLEIPHGNSASMKGTWRHVEAGAASGFIFCGQPIVCSDNLHWTELDSSENIRICGFDVETEYFSIFSFPPMGYGFGDLSVLRGCLCVSYILGDDFVIWLMKEYQVEESWTIEYKLSTIGYDFDWVYLRVEPIKLFKDGDILMLLDENSLIYYSNKTRTFQEVGMFKDLDVKDYIDALIFNPSLFSLKKFGFENVISF
ncbi:soyasapogenol B glucuronide galactosyltransferase [Salvia divinorum]|uniref:Soyasapogenol B glucuronide galactosyltransferase n=1 Tax=Salvia divinorum TaxID=28513 RepID=A0ABD1FPF6_SALDI